MANDNQPGQAPQHMRSQEVPQGNHTPGAGQPLEKQMLELARREKEVRKMQESLKGSVSFDSLKERAKTDRNSLLKELGLDDLIQEDSNDPLTAVKKQLADMENKLRLKEQAQEDEQYFNSLKSKLGEKPDDYELVSKLGYENQVLDAIKAYKAEHGEMPDEYQIAKQLEDTIFQQISSLKGSKKLSGLFSPEPSPTNQARHPLDQGSTLTNSDRTSTQSTESAPTLTRQQMLEQASKLIKFND